MILLPKIAETQPPLIIVGKFLPESLATFHISITEKERKDLPRPTTVSNPNTNGKDFDRAMKVKISSTSRTSSDCAGRIVVVNAGRAVIFFRR